MGAKLGIALGQRIKELRERARLSQADLAKLALKSVETISNFERGKTIPSVRTLGELARHIDCEVADFFKGSELKKPDRDPAIIALGGKLKVLDAKDRALLLDFAELLAARSRR